MTPKDLGDGWWGGGQHMSSRECNRRDWGSGEVKELVNL